MTEREGKIDFFLTKSSPREVKSKISGYSSLFIVDIQKIIKDLGYDSLEFIRPESEFILDLHIRKKISQGIYNCKGECVLVCHREMPESFEENFEKFLELENSSINYNIYKI
jgi:hypothetical protein